MQPDLIEQVAAESAAYIVNCLRREQDECKLYERIHRVMLGGLLAAAECYRERIKSPSDN